MASVRVIAYRESWPNEFAALAQKLRSALGELAADVQHIGSTSVPGMAATDAIDVQVLTPTLDCERELVRRFASINAGRGHPVGERRTPRRR